MADLKGRICVFTGSRPGARPEYSAAARRLGHLLTERGYGLVYGGGNVGLMAVVAGAGLGRRGHGIRGLPGALVAPGVAPRGGSELRIVKTMHQPQRGKAGLVRRLHG